MADHDILKFGCLYLKWDGAQIYDCFLFCGDGEVLNS